MRTRAGDLDSVRAFWEAESCGERYGRADAIPDYSAIDDERYRLEPHIADWAEFDRTFTGRAIEIGLGTASDYVRNVKRGGSWSGLDLTSRALGHARNRVPGARVVQGDAQRLPVRSDSLDHVYSWGVLLCCPDLQAAVDEVHRVLRRGGTATVMLYHVRSWVTLAAWVRWGSWRLIGPRRAANFMESPGTQVVSIGEARKLFERFSEVVVEPVHTTWDTRWVGPIGRLGGRHLGWHVVCRATK